MTGAALTGRAMTGVPSTRPALAGVALTRRRTVDHGRLSASLCPQFRSA